MNTHNHRLLLLTLALGALFNQFSAIAAGFTLTSSMNVPRYYHTATLLTNGLVLVVGGYNGTNSVSNAELYDPVTETWTFTGNLNTPRNDHTATLLPNGKVLVAGGNVGGINSSSTNTTELYDPVSGTWSPSGTMSRVRSRHSAALLASGKVLVSGGLINSPGTTAELYNPLTGFWTATGSMLVQRWSHSTTLLLNGKMLVLGSILPFNVNIAPDLYDPIKGTWTVTGGPNLQPGGCTSTFLSNGKILRAGGAATASASASPLGATNTASLYDPDTGTWTATGSMTAKHARHSATLLPNGQVLVAGGVDSANAISASADIYDSATGTWAATGPLNSARFLHTATLLPNGKVMIAGGLSGSTAISATELYDSTDWTATPIVLASAWMQSGSLFQFSFAANPNGTNTILATTNVALPTTNWSSLGTVGEIQPGLYLVTDTQATNYPHRFYQVRSP